MTIFCIGTLKVRASDSRPVSVRRSVMLVKVRAKGLGVEEMRYSLVVSRGFEGSDSGLLEEGEVMSQVKVVRAPVGDWS
jgi:hypothetical protein